MMNIKQLFHVIIITAFVMLSGCGGDETPKTPAKSLIMYYGDSLVHHSGDRLQTFTGVTTQNNGIDAQMTYHAITGVYGSLDWSKDALYVFSWGTNEALQNISSDQFRSDLNYVVTTAKNLGKPVVIESPLRGQFADVILEVSKLHGVPVASYTPSASEFISDGVHLNGEGLDNRAKVLADVVTKELYRNQK